MAQGPHRCRRGCSVFVHPQRVPSKALLVPHCVKQDKERSWQIVRSLRALRQQAPSKAGRHAGAIAFPLAMD